MTGTDGDLRQREGARAFRPRVDPGRRCAWPAELGRRFMVTVDTEEEFDWSAPFARANRGIRNIAALPAAHAQFARAGVPLTFLVDYPVADNLRAVDILADLVGQGTGSAVGAQLHPWVNPPDTERVNARNSMLGNLPVVVQRAKIAALTDLLTERFGRAPQIFRAGRYGLGEATLGLVAAHGYTIDSSMRAYHDYRAIHGPDYGAISGIPFRPLPGSPLVELPLSVAFTGAWRAGGARLHRAAARVPLAAGMLARTGLISRIALTPEGMPIRDALAAIRSLVEETDLPVLNFAFHSPSLVPGHTPYVRSAQDLDAFFRWWDAAFALLARLGVTPIGEADLVAALQRSSK